MKVKSLSRVQLFETPWTVAYQAPPSVGFFQARVLEWGAMAFSKMAPEGTANPQRWAELATTDERPNGDCNTEEGRGHLERYRGAILQGLKAGPQNL